MKNKINSFSIVIIFLILVLFVIIRYYNTHCLFFLAERDYTGVGALPAVMPEFTYVYNNGVVYNGNEPHSGFEQFFGIGREADKVLNKESLKDLRQLIKELKQKTKKLEENNQVPDRFSIGDRIYSRSSLDDEINGLLIRILKVIWQSE